MTLPSNASSVSSPSQNELDQHLVKAVRERKRDRVKKLLKGIWAYIRTPIGICVAIYGFLVVFWGAALVIILAGWIPMKKHTQDVWVEICSQILNGLFTVTGVGFIPWRAMDTYHMFTIAYYSRLIKRRRRMSAAAAPVSSSGIDHRSPTRSSHAAKDVEEGRASRQANAEEPDEWLLSPAEEAKLTKSEEAFMKSQTWFRPRETPTHKVRTLHQVAHPRPLELIRRNPPLLLLLLLQAFPIGMSLAIVLLVDGNSLFQCMLCGCMWGLSEWDTHHMHAAAV